MTNTLILTLIFFVKGRTANVWFRGPSFVRCLRAVRARPGGFIGAALVASPKSPKVSEALCEH